MSDYYLPLLILLAGIVNSFAICKLHKMKLMIPFFLLLINSIILIFTGITALLLLITK